jgi:hypothetical protein
MGQLMGVGGSTNAKQAGGYNVGSRFLQLKTEPNTQDIESIFLFATAWSIGATAGAGTAYPHFPCALRGEPSTLYLVPCAPLILFVIPSQFS